MPVEYCTGFDQLMDFSLVFRPEHIPFSKIFGVIWRTFIRSTGEPDTYECCSQLGTASPGLDAKTWRLARVFDRKHWWALRKFIYDITM